MVIVDADGRIVHWNDAAERFFGYTAAEAVGQPVDLIVPEDPREGHWTIAPMIRSHRRPPLRAPMRDTSVMHPPSGGFAALEVFGVVPVYQALSWAGGGGLEPPTP